MENRFKHLFFSVAIIMAIGGTSLITTSCEDFDMSKSIADYDPRYKGNIEAATTAYTLNAEDKTIDLTFNADMDWSVAVVDADGNECSWATASPKEGVAGENQKITITMDENDDTKSNRSALVKISTQKGNTKDISIVQNYKVLYLKAADIKDYEKYICPASSNPHFEQGPEYMLRHDSYYSWHRMKQSEHFFVFWSPEFGADPNSAENVATGMNVDIDDLLKKAEQFFKTNVETIGMAELGKGKSMLDNYKMQIYLIYQDEWLATGAGYDNNIGALWVNPSTCKPVGSTIAHEIGHSFQYQVYADKINKQGVANELHQGFRYGFGPQGAGGCAFWEQCAQWQAQVDYPQEMFGYHVDVWKKNCHRHFNHEWMRYASYWLQHTWVEKHGFQAYGNIWKQSEFPEDPLETYKRLYCQNSLDNLYNELYDYAARMVNYDLKFASSTSVPERVKGDYSTELYKVGENKYQVGYASCPGTTGFNVVKLKVPSSGTTVTTKLTALTPGSKLVKGDKGQQVDGDGAVVAKTDKYNQQDNQSSNYRCGYVAVVNGKPVYSKMNKGKDAIAEYTIPAGTDALYFVVMAAPDTYNRQYWNDKESDDEQWPYSIEINGTDVNSYVEVVEVNIDPASTPKNCSVIINIKGDINSSYDFAHYNLAYYDNAAICYAFCLTPEQIAEKLQHSKNGVAEGKITLRLKQTDGSYSYDDNCGGEMGGFWCDKSGNLQGWGANARSYTKYHSITDVEVGFMPGNLTAGETYPQVVEMVYMKDGKEYIATLNYNFIVN